MRRRLPVSFAFAALALAAVSADDQGPQGPQGTQGTQGTQLRAGRVADREGVSARIQDSPK